MRLALSFPPSAGMGQSPRFTSGQTFGICICILIENPFAGQPPHLCGVTLRIAAPEIRRGDPSAFVEKPSESSRGPKPSRTFNRAQRRVRWARDDFCGGKSHFPEQKSFPCRFCARGFRRNPSKVVGVVIPAGSSNPAPVARRTRVVLFVHLVSFDFLSFHLDLSRNSASFPKR